MVVSKCAKVIKIPVENVEEAADVACPVEEALDREAILGNTRRCGHGQAGDGCEEIPRGQGPR